MVSLGRGNLVNGGSFCFFFGYTFNQKATMVRNNYKKMADYLQFDNFKQFAKKTTIVLCFFRTKGTDPNNSQSYNLIG